MGAKEKDNILVKVSDWFFKNWRLTAVIWVVIIFGGGIIYTNIIKREGFPAIQFPLSVVQGTYFVADADRVDSEVSQPLYEIINQDNSVKSVTTTSGGDFFSAIVSFEEGVDANTATKDLEEAVKKSNEIPNEASLSYVVIDPAGFLNEFDMLLSVYVSGEASVEELEKVADYVTEEIQKEENIVYAEKQGLVSKGINPQTGAEITQQTNFNSVGLSQKDQPGKVEFYNAITIGVDRDKEQIDIIELSDQMTEKVSNLNLEQFNNDEVSYRVIIGADFAESINTQINSLQSNLFTGLLAVAVISLLMIGWRASIITGLFMVSVMAATVMVLYLVGYTLNTITLFALVLSLGLFVDDATIVVEAIDANRKKKKKASEIVHGAIKKVGAASFAGTFTTVLVFLPLAFLSGILGEFIRLMPITIIIALITSLFLSLTIIPFLSKFIMLNAKGTSWFTRINPIAKLEVWAGKCVGAMPRLLKTKPKAGKLVAFAMFSMSIVFMMGAGQFASKLSFNIFPPTKDSDQIGFQIRFPEGYTINQAQDTAGQINNIIEEEIGENVRRVLYGSFEQPNARSADALIELVPFSQRDIKSPELINNLQTAINDQIPKEVSIRVVQYDAGPPLSEFPLTIQVVDEDIEKGTKLALEVQEHIDGASQFLVTRVDGERTLTVQGSFNADDTSALLALSEDYVKEKFTPEYLSSNGYSEDALGFDFGQETENAKSFASLAWAFPLALLLMYVLLATQFRSLIQPALIFVAIPFTFFGVFGGLYLTDNALSFFVQVGLIGLIGIAVNNTILLTDYANQERRSGLGAIDSIANATTKRFRPLVTTTVTTVVALLPLALSDPFWEALAFTIIFGLISSTFLVIFSFPYYYLAAEWFRMRMSKGTRKARKNNRLKKKSKKS